MIKKLDDFTIKQIAAGEIIEGPVSVVKELIENSIDAGSKTISILIVKAGKVVIKVTDDGEGIARNEVMAAMERHATSKIAKPADLYSLTTLGFRGEALPSIAAVSKLLLEARRLGEETGTRAYFIGGKLIKKSEVGLPQGTMIEVKDLLFNVPARKKFMRQDSSELKKIVTLVQKFCLSYPHISFTLSSKNRLLLKTTGNGSLEEIIKKIFGQYFFEELLEINYQEDSFSLQGYIGKPSFTRPHRREQFFFVNNRIVRSDLMRKAVEAGYSKLLMSRQYPVAIINISVPPHLVDVNIHPAKMDVRFKNEKEIFAKIKCVVEDTLKSPRIIPTLKDRPHKKQDGKQPANTNHSIYFSPSLPLQNNNDVYSHKVKEHLKPYDDNNESKAEPAGINCSQPNNMPTINITGQFLLSYITGSMGDEFVFIDQHAAHERIIYEELMEKAENYTTSSSQQMAMPRVMEFPSHLTKNISENIILLEDIGFIVEQFGNNTFIIRSLPPYLQDIWSETFLFNILTEIAEEKYTSIELLLQKIITMTACKKAIKANQKMHIEEMEKLISDLRKTNNPYSCPHGRPTMLRVTKKNLDSFFKRSGGKVWHE